jgi:hypothetical protein
VANKFRVLSISLLLATVALAGCGGGDARLEALRSDPMADVDLPDAVDAKTTESLEGDTPAKIRQTFTVPAGSVFEGVEVFASAARSAGWDLQPAASGGYEGSKEIDGLSAKIIITGLDDGNVLWVEISTRDS